MHVLIVRKPKTLQKTSITSFPSFSGTETSVRNEMLRKRRDKEKFQKLNNFIPNETKKISRNYMMCFKNKSFQTQNTFRKL